MAFHFNFDFIKKHPYGSGAVIIIGGIILYLLMRGGSSAASSGGTSSDQAATQFNQVLALQQDKEQAQYAMAQLQATAATNAATIAAYRDITLGQQASEVQTLQVNKQAEVQSEAIDAQVKALTLQSQTQQLAINAQVKMNQDQLAAAVAQSNTAAALQAHLSDTNAALQAHIVDTNSNAQVAITQINADTQRGIAQTNAKASKHNSNVSAWAGVAVAALSLFSEKRVKKDIKKIAPIAGIPHYSYRMINDSMDAPKIHGVMVDDVEIFRPDVVTLHPCGLKTVNYGSLYG